MKLDQVIKLMEIYGECPICKNNLISCKKDDFIVDEHSFTRKCKCGYEVTIKETVKKNNKSCITIKEKNTKRIKKVYDEEFKLKVINYAIESGARYKDIEEKFNVPRTTFNLWINKLKTTNKELYDTYKKIIAKKHHENRSITLTLNAIKNYPKNKNRGEINSVEDFNNLLIKMANDLLDTKSNYGYLERKYEIPRNLISKYFNTKLPKLDKELYEKVLYRNNLNLMKGVSKAVAINKNRFIEYHKKETEKKNLYQKNVNDIVLEMRKKNRK